jgi:phospholipid-translocating ATPase
MDKLRKIRDRCYERNVVLKFSKSTFGFTHVKFFGYKVQDGKWCLDDDRKQAVTDTPMPTDLKKMQRFLGVGIFFSEFIPDYATKSAKLYDMTKPSFNWDQSTWKEDYLTEFENMKRSLAESVDRYFPDWDLPWILRVDASDVAVCAVLLMVKRVNAKDVFCPIGFKSTKFSGAAIRWDIHKKEAFACYWGVKVFAYYLHGKEFVIETDHKNLLYMEKSEAAIVIRWRIYLQGFMVFLRHIAGKHNISDWGTRMYMLGDWRAWHADHMEQVQPILSCLKCFEDSAQTEDILCVECDVTPGKDPKFYLDQVHGG